MCKSPFSKLTLFQSLSKSFQIALLRRTLSNRLPWHIMGVGAYYVCPVDTSVPPGGSTLVLTNPEEWYPRPPRINSKEKPSCLSMLEDARWNEWMGKLQQIVNQYFNQMLPGFLVPIASFVMAGIIIANQAGLDIPMLAAFGVLLGTILVVFVWSAFLVIKNQGAEQTWVGFSLVLVAKEIHPQKLTWNLKMDPWKRRFLLETTIFRFHVSFKGVYIINLPNFSSKHVVGIETVNFFPEVRKL